MKRLWYFMLGAILLLYTSMQAQNLPGTANVRQAPKPLLFATLPSAFEINKGELQRIFSAEVGENLKLQLSSHLLIEGIVVDKNQHNAASVTVNVRVSNYANALFNISLRLNADNSTTIQGRILHPKYGDVLQLYKDQDKYYIKKNTQALFMPE